jgi:HAMP domain-containing protein
MDPDEAWRQICERAKKLRDDLDRGDPLSNPITADADEVLELVQAVGGLEEWLKKGGFPPSALRR